VGTGRLFRFTDDGWQPFGDPLPPFAHAPPDPGRPLAPWVLPRELDPQQWDVVVVDEQVHQLMVPLGADDDAVQALWHQTTALHTAAEAREWFAQITVWLGRRVEPGRPWPEPQ